MQWRALLLMMVGVSGSFAHAEEYLCSQKRAVYTQEPPYVKSAFSCNAVVWPKPITTSYQPKREGLLSKILGDDDLSGEFKNKYYKMKPSKKSPYAMPLTQKFLETMKGKVDSATLDWLNRDWKPRQEPNLKKRAWAGKCLEMSQWGSIPEFQDLFHNMTDEVTCRGEQYDKGELKELMTALFGYIDQTEHKSSIYRVTKEDDDNGNWTPSIQCNNALEKLNALGANPNGDSMLQPDKFLSEMQKLKDTGGAAIFEKDVRYAKWNQPIHKVIEVRYQLLNQSVEASLSMTDFKPASNLSSDIERLRASNVYDIMVNLEETLILQALQSPEVPQAIVNSLCTAYKSVQGSCPISDDPSSVASYNVDQISAEFQKLKKAAAQKYLQTKGPRSLVKVEYFVIYGDETNYQSNQDANFKTINYSAEIVMDEKGNATHSSWTIPPKSNVANFIFDTLFTFKPDSRNVRFYDEQDNPAPLEHRKAFDALVSMIKECKANDGSQASPIEAERFYYSLQDAFLNNEVSPSEIQDLTTQFNAQKAFINEARVEQILSENSTADNIGALRSALGL